jgi:hypothetical protein
MRQPRKIYAPVTEFEQATSNCALYLAWRILDEARDYFRTSWVPSPGSGTLARLRPLARPSRAFASQIPFAASQAAQVSSSDAEKACLMSEGLADKLARRAEAVFAHHPSWQRRFKSARGREAILTSMRHWLAGELARENPALFRDLPESFKVGHPLPEKQIGGAATPPYHKSKMAGLTCRSVQISNRRRSRSDALAGIRVHPCPSVAKNLIAGNSGHPIHPF